MILQRSIRQRAAAPLLKAHILPSQPRRTFWMPVMNEAQEWTEKGIGGLMSPEQFRMAWTDNQGRMVAELNRLTDGTPYSSMSTLSLLVQTARDPDQAQLFNFASMAHNNHFFFKTLSGQPTRPSTRFGTELEEHFSSAASLRATFLASAEAMFAPGFVWLVQNAAATGAGAGNKYAILNTYAAGSPYAAASFRRQPSTAATADNGVVRGQPIVPNVGFLRGAGHNAKTVPGGVDTVPLMCVSTWEHAYLRDFGVAGRRQYLEAWWDHIDWAKVEQHLASNQPTSESWRTV